MKATTIHEVVTETCLAHGVNDRGLMGSLAYEIEKFLGVKVKDTVPTAKVPAKGGQTYTPKV